MLIPIQPSSLAVLHRQVQATKKIKLEKSALEDQLVCVVCMDQQRSVTLKPCNHYNLCAVCAAREDLVQCPTCRTPITAKEHLFMP